MRTLRSALIAAALFVSSSAFAAQRPNLAVSVSPPAPANVYANGTYGVTVANIGNKDAASVVLTIQLPQTGTSPQTYIMGNLVSYTVPACALGGAAGTAAGTRLVCTLGTVAKGSATSVSFTIQLPEKTGALNFVASATTTTQPETDALNNSVPFTANLNYYTNAVPLDVDVENEHCTGTGLTAWFECTKFPGSIASHLTQFHGNGTLTFPTEPGYGGTWSASGNALTFTYTRQEWYAVLTAARGTPLP